MSTPPPKVPLDPHPPKYETPIPSLPRPPRVPSDAEQLLRPDIEHRDTDRTHAISGEHEVTDDADKTPAESPYTLKRLSEKMDQALAAAEKAATSSADARVAARDAADNSVEMMSRLNEFARQLKALAQRVTSLEVSRQWAPLLFASLAIALTIWLAFKVHDLELQVQQLKQVLEP